MTRKATKINTLPILDYKNKEGHMLFDKKRAIWAAAHEENRSLSKEEPEIIFKIDQQTKQCYDKVLEQTLYVNNKKIRTGAYGILVR